jgi:galactoside O-acetyltransferase
MAFLNSSQLLDMGFLSCGKHVLISDRASFHGCSRISLGDSVRIDDFCVLSAGEGGITIGNHVHLACFSSLIGMGAITLEDFSNVSSRVSIYSSNDDYSGETMTNPTVPDDFKNVDHRPVTIGRHCVIGCGSVILPGVSLGAGAIVGALSLIKGKCEEFGIYAGVPALKIGDRLRNLLEIENRFHGTLGHG